MPQKDREQNLGHGSPDTGVPNGVTPPAELTAPVDPNAELLAELNALEAAAGLPLTIDPSTIRIVPDSSEDIMTNDPEERSGSFSEPRTGFIGNYPYRIIDPDEKFSKYFSQEKTPKHFENDTQRNRPRIDEPLISEPLRPFDWDWSLGVLGEQDESGVLGRKERYSLSGGVDDPWHHVLGTLDVTALTQALEADRAAQRQAGLPESLIITDDEIGNFARYHAELAAAVRRFGSPPVVDFEIPLGDPQVRGRRGIAGDFEGSEVQFEKTPADRIPDDHEKSTFFDSGTIYGGYDTLRRNRLVHGSPYDDWEKGLSYGETKGNKRQTNEPQE